MKKLAKDLAPGDRISPPVHERGWLKNTMRVLEIREASPDKNGPWLWVAVEYVSPYDLKSSQSKFRFRPTTGVEIIEKPVRTLWCVNDSGVYPIQVYEPAVESELACSNVFATEAEARKKLERK